MKIQVLVATMNQNDHSLVEKMNIKTDAIIGNQCNRNSIEAFKHGDQDILFLNFAEKGVGLNRNNALMRATGDVCLFADDDMIYENDYSEVIQRAFVENSDADVIVFNLKEPKTIRPVIQKKINIGYFNYLRYGTARIAVRLKSVKERGIYFNQCFGGGTEHCHGEDNLFLNACLKSGLKIVGIPVYIATLTEDRASSWSHGFDEKYIKDQGVLYHTLSRRWWKLLCLQDALRRHKSYNKSFGNAFALMINAGKTIDRGKNNEV